MKIRKKWTDFLSRLVKTLACKTAHVLMGGLSAFLFIIDQVELGLGTFSIFMLYEFANLFHGDEPSEEILEFGLGWTLAIIVFLTLIYFVEFII
jgi:hypothetical protein